MNWFTRIFRFFLQKKIAEQTMKNMPEMSPGGVVRETDHIDPDTHVVKPLQARISDESIRHIIAGGDQPLVRKGPRQPSGFMGTNDALRYNYKKAK